MKKALSCLTFVIVVMMSIGTVNAGLPTFSPKNFPKHPTIDNKYFPLEPGTTFLYEPFPNEENVLNIIEVTNQTETILGIKCIVVHDWETVNGELSEDTYDWYAQDKYGNVWYFGEDTIKYLEDGSISTEGSWKAGVDGAKPGIVMLADPIPGLSYRQEYYKGVAEDMAKVLRLNAMVSVEYGDFDECLKTKEWTPLDPGVIENKYYAPGAGLVLIEELKEKTVRVELIDKY